MWGAARAADDTKRYRDGYPGQANDLTEKLNLLFYTNKLRSRPHGDFIDVIHREWRENYDLLEEHHGYIQWLFPIREEGMNFQSQRLHLHELQGIMANADAKKRLLRSYRLMLDFYGMVLPDSDPAQRGALGHSKRWQKRFYNLNTSGHNYLRITRILKCLGELGYEPLKFGFCAFVLNEVKYGNLTRTFDSCVRYWIPVIRSEDERKQLMALAEEAAAVRQGKKTAKERVITPVDTIWDDADEAAAKAAAAKAKAGAVAGAAVAGDGKAADPDAKADAAEAPANPAAGAAAGPGAAAAGAGAAAAGAGAKPNAVAAASAAVNPQSQNGSAAAGAGADKK